MDGILIVNKPTGITSHDVVVRIRHLIKGATRVGHAGTLDPMASGVLVILIGDATKRQREFMSSEKTYQAIIRLGASSTTDDAEGAITENTNSKIPNERTVADALLKFTGVIEQIPPAYSAVKIKGRKAYDLARRGEKPTLRPRNIKITEIGIIRYNPPLLELHIRCSAGTYIRALARDLGVSLGVGGYLAALTRIQSGNFTIEDAIDMSLLTPENITDHIKPA